MVRAVKIRGDDFKQQVWHLKRLSLNLQYLQKVHLFVLLSFKRQRLMRFRRVSVYIKVSRCLRQLQLETLELVRENYLTTESGVFFEERRHVQQVFLLLGGFGQAVEVFIENVDVTSRASQRCFASTFHLDPVTMRQIQNVIAHFSLHFSRFSILISVCDVDTKNKLFYSGNEHQSSTYISLSDLGSCHS